MTPDYETLLKGCTRWRGRHLDVAIEISHHGYRASPFAHPGTWCYYLFLEEPMFSPEHWAELASRSESDYLGEVHNYDAEIYHQIEFNGGPTFGEITKAYNRRSKTCHEVVKVGCDYAHLWDNERGYPDTYASVLFDAKVSVRKLLELCPPVRIRCAYSGVWCAPAETYIAKNGHRVSASATVPVDSLWSPA